MLRQSVIHTWQYNPLSLYAKQVRNTYSRPHLLGIIRMRRTARIKVIRPIWIQQTCLTFYHTSTWNVFTIPTGGWWICKGSICWSRGSVWFPGTTTATLSLKTPQKRPGIPDVKSLMKGRQDETCNAVGVKEKEREGEIDLEGEKRT